MKINYLKIFIIMGVISLSILSVNGQQAGWRGPGRSGIYNETGLLKTWPQGGPALLWEASGIGTGYSSVTATADAVYITGRKGADDVLTSFSQNGKKNWEVIYGLKAISRIPAVLRHFQTVKFFLLAALGIWCASVRTGK
jgi:outer membrane protein assembly factor BamB